MKKLLDGNILYSPSQQLESPVASTALAMSNLSRDISTYIQWRNQDVTHVPADHWLVSYLLIAISKIGYNPTLTIQETLKRADSVSTELARVFGFTTEYSAGRLHIGDNGDTTVYLIGKSPYRKVINDTTPHWNIVPLRFLSHSSTSMSMGNHAEAEELIGSGYTVIELDLGLLHYQAVQFINYWTTRNPEAPRNLQQLVAMHVLPKLKQSQYDIALMNRITALVQAGPLNSKQYRLTKSFADRHTEIDHTLTAIAKAALVKELSFTQAISLLPTPLKNNPFITLSFNDYLETRNIGWALLVTRYGLMDYLFNICRVDANRSKRWPIDAFSRQIRRMVNSGTMSAVLNLSDREAFMNKVKALLEMAEY